jgi:RHH-type transcriptional regulator, rel operon repressor / antitoxin RelB
MTEQRAGRHKMISIRLDKQMEREVATAAKVRGVTKSEFIRACLREYLGGGPSKSAWELGKDVFGKYGSGRTDLARNAKQIAREKIHAKKGNR